MRGAPAKVIQDLAGHANLTTTMRYMHLLPAARQNAIGLLDTREEARLFGEMLETTASDSATFVKVCRRERFSNPSQRATPRAATMDR
jgi:hypothetical protein